MASISHLFARTDTLFPEGVDSAEMRTFGDRVKYARTSAGLTQDQLAAGVNGLAKKTRMNRGAVSQIEADKIKSPRNTTVLAISAVTGFAQQWLVTGQGPMYANLPGLKIADKDSPGAQMFRRSVLIAAHAHHTPAAIAAAALEVYGTLCDEPDAPEAALRRVARQAVNKAAS